MHVTAFFLLKPHLLSVYRCMCVGMCIYIGECFHMYVIHILLRGLEKELQMQTGGRMISKCSLESWSCKESNTLPVMTHISPVKSLIYPHFCNISNSLCLIFPSVLCRVEPYLEESHSPPQKSLQKYKIPQSSQRIQDTSCTLTQQIVSQFGGIF